MELTNRFVSSLPADVQTRNYCRQVRNACYSYVAPTSVVEPTLIAYSPDVADLLGIDRAWFKNEQAARVLAGNELMPGSQPYAACYGGHQFGSWAGQLGDGRAINLGEIKSPDGSHWTLQLKGSGRTPYSRSGDGLAVLRSSLREFLCSEAMHHLGVPTTRALSLVLTGEKVTRDMFYDGHPKQEPGAIVCRVARTFVRFGNFEILTARGEIEILKKLVDFTIASDFPHLDIQSSDVLQDWFEEVCVRTARMIVEWMRVGFVHGVMNTDNMSILGQSIDYGPYGWIDSYEPNWTPNTTDAAHKRYAFASQPKIAHWNLLQLANALWPLLEREEPLQHGLNRYVQVLHSEYRTMMAKKLGLLRLDQPEAGDMIDDLDRVMQLTETDMTLFYRTLATIRVDGISINELDTLVTHEWTRNRLRDAYYDADGVDAKILEDTSDWMRKYLGLLLQEKRCDSERETQMNRVNPIYVLRNYLAQQAI
ncbi:MAG: protein adenylyltransferase SelO, partial [Pirellula sp.]